MAKNANQKQNPNKTTLSQASDRLTNDKPMQKENNRFENKKNGANQKKQRDGDML